MRWCFRRFQLIMRYLAIDHGGRRVGLAICDANETISSPLAVLDRRGNIFEEILAVVDKEDVEAVVIGLPLNMDDSEGPQARKVREFASELRKRLEIPIHFQDERLSSFEAEQKFASVDRKRKHKRKPLDALAAAHILQTFLEERSCENNQAGPMCSQ